jgi:hypothetical protein
MRTGLTLVEVMIVALLLTVIAGALLVCLWAGRNSYVSSDTYIQVQQEVRRAFDQMVRELREAGRVNNDVSIAEPGVQRLDFQLALSYDAAACGGICWGTEDVAFPNGWVHYVLDVDAADPDHARLMRCVTAGQLDAMPAGFAGCRVLANDVSAELANSGFVYDHANQMVTMKIQAAISSPQLPGGGLSTTPAPLVTRVQLRNP